MTRALTESYWPATDDDVVLDLTVGGMLRRAATEYPTRTALVEGTASPDCRRWTYAELLADVAGWHRALQQVLRHPLQPDDLVSPGPGVLAELLRRGQRLRDQPGVNEQVADSRRRHQQRVHRRRSEVVAPLHVLLGAR